MSTLEAVDLYRFYHAGDDETLALRGVSLAVDAGEIVAVVGPSGSGKSTLLACLAGLDEPDGGHVLLLGDRLTRRPEAERARRRAAHVGMLMQSGNLFEGLSVEDNLRLQMRLARRPDPQRLRMLVERVGLTGRHAARPGQLSGGETARAGMAVALAPAPALLLADEPTGELDAVAEQQVIDLLEAHRQDGGAALVVTHSRRLAQTADRVLHLLDGRLES